MKRSWEYTMRATFIAIVAVTMFAVHARQANAAGSLYLAPAVQAVSQSAIISVAVRENSGTDQVNAVQANINYPATLLEFVDIQTTGSAFDITAPSSGGNGLVSIARAVINPVTGDKLVALIRFRVKGVSGVASLTFAADSAVVRSTDNTDILSQKNGATYTISVSAPRPTPSSSSRPSTSPSTTPSVTPPAPSSFPTLEPVPLPSVEPTFLPTAEPTPSSSPSPIAESFFDIYGRLILAGALMLVGVVFFVVARRFMK